MLCKQQIATSNELQGGLAVESSIGVELQNS